MKSSRAILCIFSLIFMISLAEGAFQSPVMGGAYDELLHGIVRGRPIVFSGKMRWEYDDNIYYDEEEEDRIESWVFSIEPKVDFHLVRERTYLGAFYQLSYRWFENREEDPEDLSHDASLTLNHMISSKFELRVRDIYRNREDQVTVGELAEQLETATGTGDDIPQVTVARMDQDDSFQRNDFRSALTYVATDKISLVGTFTHMWLDYEEERRSLNNDRTEYVLGGRAEYAWKENTSLSLGYNFTDIDYDVNQTKVDSKTDTYYGGINHRFSQVLVGKINVGWQDRTYESYTYEDNEGEEVFVPEQDQNNPYIELGMSAPLSETLITSFGYTYSISETDQSLFLSQELQRFYISMTNKFSQRLSVRFNGIMQFGYFPLDQERFEGSVPDAYSEDTIEFALVFRYQIKEGWFAETGWRYIDVDSDFPGDTYERNRTYVGLNAIF